LWFSFASVGFLGGNVGYAIESQKVGLTFMGVTSESNNKVTGLVFGITGSNYMGKQANWGVGYSVSMGKTLTAESDGTSADTEEYPLALIITLTGRYRSVINKTFEIQAGAGFTYSHQSEEDNVKVTASVLSLSAEVDALYSLSSNVPLRAGLSLGFPVSAKYTLSGSGTTISYDITISGVTFTPSVGVVYRY
jgi:hypothetical protein